MTDAELPAIQLVDAVLRRGDRTIWSHGNLSVPRGSTIVVLGPNGSGKTSLLHVVLGLLPLAGGRVEVLGEAPRRGDHRIGYVPQNYTATVGDAVRALDLVTLGLTGTRWGLGRPAPDERRRIDAAIEAVGAQDYAGARMSELSGGQQQRVAIAQALVDRPDLLLLDEPLANLDVRNQQEIVDLLGRIRVGESEVGGRRPDESPVTIVVVAHDLNPLLPALTGAIYLLDGHPHYDAIGEVVDERLLSHLYGTSIRVVRTAHGDLFTRSG
jgi:zinc/manganese transport system ATP-binding protein